LVDDLIGAAFPVNNPNATVSCGGTMRAVSALMIELPSGGWAVLSGIVDVVLGIMLLAAWPFSGLWFLGLAVGIGLLFRGAWWSAFALAARKSPERPATV